MAKRQNGDGLTLKIELDPDGGPRTQADVLEKQIFLAILKDFIIASGFIHH
jgi:hypothetical protein